MYLISHSEIINKIYQSLESTKDLFVSSVIYGDKYSGKRSLVNRIYNNSVWVSGKNLKETQKALKENHYVVITEFEKITDLDALDFENVNIVAIYNGKQIDSRIENKFAFLYYMPSLKERKDDIELFSNYYIQQAKELYDIKDEINLKPKDIDISKNLKSLKSSIYKATLLKSLDKDDISYVLYDFFSKNYNGNSVYKEHLEIFEKALISAGLDIYKSQLKLSEILGINRNTLRKKINEYF